MVVSLLVAHMPSVIPQCDCYATPDTKETSFESLNPVWHLSFDLTSKIACKPIALGIMYSPEFDVTSRNSVAQMRGSSGCSRHM